jgi:hypothetical protein
MVEELTFQPIPGLLAGLLLERYSGGEDSPTARDLILDEMTDTIGTTCELVSKTLHRFADEGMIKINRVESVFVDKVQL